MPGERDNPEDRRQDGVDPRRTLTCRGTPHGVLLAQATGGDAPPFAVVLVTVAGRRVLRVARTANDALAEFDAVRRAGA